MFIGYVYNRWASCRSPRQYAGASEAGHLWAAPQGGSPPVGCGAAAPARRAAARSPLRSSKGSDRSKGGTTRPAPSGIKAKSREILMIFIDFNGFLTCFSSVYIDFNSDIRAEMACVISTRCSNSTWFSEALRSFRKRFRKSSDLLGELGRDGLIRLQAPAT